MASHRYKIVDITPSGLRFPPDAEIHGTMGINNLGEVVYAFNVPDGTDAHYHAFIWLPCDHYGLSAGLHDITADLDTYNDGHHLGIPRDINDSGIVVGQTGSGTDAGIYAHPHDEACAWDMNNIGTSTFFQSFGTLSSSMTTWSGANAINDESPYPLIIGNTVVTGQCHTCDSLESEETSDSDILHAFQLHFNSTSMTALESDPDFTNGANDVLTPSSSEIIGGFFACTSCKAILNECDPHTNAAQWEGGFSDSVPDLSTTAGSTVRGLNNLQNGVGWARRDSNASSLPCQRRAIFWADVTNASTTYTVLDAPHTATHQAWAEAINSVAQYPQAVGWDADDTLGTLWEFDGTTWTANDLNDIAFRAFCFNESTAYPKWIIRRAHDVNNSGWIAAITVRSCASGGVQYDAVVLIPDIACEADRNGDDMVNVDDLLIVINGWGACSIPSMCPGDVTENGTVNVDDLLAVINAYGACPTYSCGEENQQNSSQHSGGEVTSENIIEALESLDVPTETIDAVRELLGLD